MGSEAYALGGDNLGPFECIIIGAGPAGLTAALYMARYRRRVLVLHDETSRALRIPLSHNVPGFPDGVSGEDLITRMTAHAAQYGAEIARARVECARYDNGLFALEGEGGKLWQGQTLILGTGLHLNQIPIPDAVHEAAIRAGVLRYCPVCDGYEHIDTRIAVVGCDTQGGREAMFMRRFSGNITLIPRDFDALSQEERAALARADVKVLSAPAADYALRAGVMEITLKDGQLHTFDVVYPALGVRPRTGLAEALGLRTDGSGCLAADTPFETQISGLYSAGDIVEGLDQIAVAMAHGAIAATKAHNWLRERDGETLP